MQSRSPYRPSHSVLALVVFSPLAVMAVPPAAHAQDGGSSLEAAVAKLEWRNIGPTIMGGRVADLAVVESNPSIFYVGTATGGVWKTVNHGTTFEPIFDHAETSSVGDVTLAPSNPNIVWVGTGEPQNRQSSPWGNGVYKSMDAGRTWSHMGLTETHHISKIRIHPRDPDVVYVAAVGHLWGSNPERGVYKTTDGGETWELVLFIDEHTGAIDLVMDPGDPNTLFAAMYQRQRTGWGFNGGGPGSGIYRTTNGGSSWSELTNGLPQGDMGRIGLDIYRGDGNLVFAIVEADARAAGRGGRGGGRGRAGGGGGGGARQTGVYKSTDRGETWEQVSTTNNRPMYYSMIRIDPNDPDRIYTGGSSLYKSVDGGRTFTPDAARNVHSDHHALWVDPANSDHLILAGDGGVSISWDRSDTWRQLRNIPIAQFYQIGVDMRDPYHVCGGLQDNGSWCAPSDTWSNKGIRPRDWYNVGSGDGFYTVMHPTEANIMLAESQGGNLTRVDLVTGERARIRPAARPQDGETERTLRWNWDAPVLISKHDPNTIYFGSNILFKSTDLGQSWREISGDLTHAIDRGTLEIMGVMGDNPMMSPHDGTSSYGNLKTLAESPIDPDLLYTGSDDGRVHVTRDGGITWTDLTGNFPGLPERTYVSRLVASHADESTVYATFDGHRNDDFAPHVYVSSNFGQSWRAIVDGLPQTSVNVIVQHPRNPDLLFVGNEVGVYFSIDGGDGWTRLKNNLPTVPVDDIAIQLRENDLVLGTHGRGIYIMPDITPLERLTADVLASETHLFPVRRATSYNEYRPQGWAPGIYESPNPPQGALIRYYLRYALTGAEVIAEESGPNGDGGTIAPVGSTSAQITILDGSGEVVRELEGPGDAGIQQVLWDLRFTPPYEAVDQQGGGRGGGGGFRSGPPRGPKVLPGTYTVRLVAAGNVQETSVEVRLDPRIVISQADLMARQDLLMSAYELAKPSYEAGQAVQRLTRQLADMRSLLDSQESAPEEVTQAVDEVRDEVRELSRDLTRARGGARGTGSVEGSTSRPSADQEWQLERAWNALPDLITRINALITERLPEINALLNEHGIRPDPGAPLEVPRRSGGN
ncbi:MAG: glycosyl hydrolase [Gemmatimonadetes bacterium]|nr:glycosyl hydrolase [Gemmatimonadota bacterium]